MDEAFRQRLRAIFQAEAVDHFAALSEAWSGLGGPGPALERAFRAAHSLKGAARAVNEAGVEARSQELENLLAALRKAPGPAPAPERLRAPLEALAAALAQAGIAVDAPAGPPARPAPAPSESAASRAAPAPPAEPARAAPPAAPNRPSPGETPAGRPSEGTQGRGDAPGSLIRIPAARVEAVVEEAEGLVSARASAAALAAALREAARDLAAARAERERALAAAPAADREGPEDPLLSALRPLEARLGALAGRAEADRDALGALSGRLSEAATGLLMFPLSHVLELVPWMARDVAEAVGKRVEARVGGGALLADRRVLEGLKDILTQLVRNAVDHGLEPPEERARAGKPPKGRVEVAAFLREGNRIEVVVRDDGRGLDAEALRRAGVREGAVEVGAAAALSDEEIHALAFRGGVTTREEATTISGRGFGLSVVADRLGRIGGTVTVESRAGRGTTFRLALPQALAHFRGLLVRAGGAPFYLPADRVERVLRLERAAVRVVEGRAWLDGGQGGEPLPLAPLDALLGLPDPGERPGRAPAVLASAGGRRVALEVESILGEEEILVRGLGPLIRRARHFSGAAVAPGGRAVPVLNVADLVATALSPRAPAAAAAAARAAKAPARPRTRVLVAEDSITSRTLLRGVLEASGYSVDVAVDGQEAWEKLQAGGHDAVVSDVEMPRMDGFGLAMRVKADRGLAGLPFVIVSSLEDPADRERGRAAGADAFVVKRTLDTGNLLEILARLLR